MFECTMKAMLPDVGRDERLPAPAARPRPRPRPRTRCTQQTLTLISFSNVINAKVELKMLEFEA